jgi:glutamyl-tRNA synthetase
VVRRHDGSAAYQLAVVVDDAAMEIDEVVRGDDLVPSALRQILLFHALDRPVPGFGHAPLLLGPDGIRLSKRHEGTAVREMRDRGWSPDGVVGLLAALLGIRPEPDPVRAADLVDGFTLERIPRAPGGIRIPEL